jgi:hypothetical protein
VPEKSHRSGVAAAVFRFMHQRRMTPMCPSSSPDTGSSRRPSPAGFTPWMWPSHCPLSSDRDHRQGHRVRCCWRCSGNSLHGSKLRVAKGQISLCARVYHPRIFLELLRPHPEKIETDAPHSRRKSPGDSPFRSCQHVPVPAWVDEMLLGREG